MAAQVLSFFQRSPRQAPAPADWSQQELAEFYRVEGALMRAGIRVGTDRGLSDENEPWFVFYRSDDGEVVIHFARIDGEYLIAGPAYEEIARGFDFTALVRNLVARHPLIRRSENGGNLSIHPAALLVAVVGTAFFKTGEARAAETGATNGQSGHSRPSLLSSSSNAGLTNGVAPIAFQQSAHDSVQIPANQAVLILAAALLASDYAVDTTSLDPSARAAISAAAAALDFGSASTSTLSSDGPLPFDGGGHLTMVDNSPAQTVPSVLSLVALLSTLPSAVDGNAPANAEDVLNAAISGHHDLTLTPLSADTANWAIDVRINWGAAPTVEAVQLVRGVVGEASFQKISVIEVAQLPDVLADIIAKSDHYSTPAANPQPIKPVILEPTPPVETPPASSDGGGSPPPETPAPTTNPAPTTPSEPSPPPYMGFASPELVREFVEYFIAHTHSVAVMTVGTEVVMFDVRTLNDPGAIAHMTSLTFDFFDGSSVSLIGDVSSFLHGGILV
jgi:hypothetical protein